MARTIRNAKLDTRSARVKLTSKREPYWTVISKGCALGYRKGTKGGTWVARFRDDCGKQHYQSLGAADDAMDSDGTLCLSYADAQRKADKWFRTAASGFRESMDRSGPYTVRDTMADYVESYRRKGGKSLDRTQSVIDAHILPSLGSMVVSKLTKRRIEQWHEELANNPPMSRAAHGKPRKHQNTDDTLESQRRRKSSANRILTVLKAALNCAHDEGKIATDDAWRKVKPFREVDSARIRYLKDDEARRLVNSSMPDFRPLVQAALLTGCRYGELTALIAADYNADSGTLHVRISKSSKPRHVVLTEEGQTFFSTAVAGKTGDMLILTREDGTPWGASHQQRPFKLACKNAKVGAASFHELRHTYASRLVMSGAPLAVVAAQLGHSDTRMVEKHYGHMSPGYVADTVRASFEKMGIVPEDTITLIHNKNR